MQFDPHHGVCTCQYSEGMLRSPLIHWCWPWSWQRDEEEVRFWNAVPSFRWFPSFLVFLPPFSFHSFSFSFSFIFIAFHSFLFSSTSTFLLSFFFTYFPLFPFSSSISLFFHPSHYLLSLFFNPLLVSLSRISYDSALTYTIRIYRFVLSCTDYGIVVSVFLLRSNSRPMYFSSCRGSHLVYICVFSFLDESY